MKPKRRPKKAGKQKELTVIRRDVAGVDIGSKEHWVCVPKGEEGETDVRVFGTTTSDLNSLIDWLLEHGIKSVAMESTSVYWIPLYELLSGRGLEAVLVNARQLSNVPGRKTDMHDCQWIRLLHSCGLLQASFRPEDSICKIRALQRQVANFQEARIRAIQWMQKALDQMNVQIHRAVSDLTGVTGLAIVRAIVDGERDPRELAKLRDGRCQKSEADIARHLEGTWKEEHLFNLKMSLQYFDQLEATIASYESKILQELKGLEPPERRGDQVPPHSSQAKQRGMQRRGEQPVREALYRVMGVDLTRIDGVSSKAALTLFAEVGMDISAFPTEHHFISWLRLSPKTPFSAGIPLKKRRNAISATRASNILRMAAVSVQRTDTALGAQYRRTAARKSGAVAVFATARRIATYVYRAIKYGQEYVDAGAAFYEAKFKTKRLKGLIASARELGFKLVADDPAIESATSLA